MLKYGHQDYLLNNLREVIFTPGDLHYGLGEPLHDYRGGHVNAIVYFYISLAVLLITLVTVPLIIISVPYLLYRYRHNNIVISIGCLLPMIAILLWSMNELIT